MFGIFFIYWIGKQYGLLAVKYRQKKWVYAIAGVAIYYGATFAFAFFIGMVGEMISPGFVDRMSDAGLTIIGIAAGLGACYGCYKLLERKWAAIPLIEDSIDEIGQAGDF